MDEYLYKAQSYTIYACMWCTACGIVKHFVKSPPTPQEDLWFRSPKKRKNEPPCSLRAWVLSPGGPVLLAMTSEKPVLG